MSAEKICRICLSSNVPVFTLKNTSLQSLYELLTGGYLKVEDGKPFMACVLCFARLNRCKKFQEQATKSNKFLQQLVTGGSSLTQLIESQRNIYGGGENFQITPIYHVHLEPINDVEVGIDCKPEKHGFVPLMNEVKDEKENEVDRLDRKEFDGNAAEFQDTSIDRQTDSEDDLPLITIGSSIKKKLETTNSVKKQEIHKKEKDFEVDAKEIELTEEEQKLELLERASSANYLNSPYKCVKCYKGFVHPQAFSNHIEKHDLRSGVHECGVCLLRYTSTRKLRAHVTSAHARRYTCAKCPHRSHTRHQAKEHEKWHNGHTYPCRICGQKFQKPTSYLTHMRKNHSEHVCVRCGDSFVGRHGLLMHLSKTHKRDELEKDVLEESSLDRFCADCNIQFLTINAWKKHVLTSFKHTLRNGSSTQCDICGEQVTPLSRGSHMRGHMRELRPQVEATPISSSTLRCEQCEGQFSTRSRLQAHVKRVHLGFKYNKNVVCEMCGKKCTSAAALRYHQRRHTGERPYACGTCTARFAERGRLRVHVRTHSGERPYACHACHKRFTQKPALNRHYRVHSGARPYACNQCSKCFSQSNSLKLHIRTVHLKLPHARKSDRSVPDTRQD